MLDTLVTILENPEEVDEPPVPPSVLLQLPPLLHPPPALLGVFEHVLVDVLVLIYYLKRGQRLED